MEMLDYLGVADFLQVRCDSKGNELTTLQRIKKIKNWLQNNVIPRSAVVAIGNEILFVREELEKHIQSKLGIKARQGITTKG